MTASQALFAAWRRAAPNAERCVDAIRFGKHGDLPRWLTSLDALPLQAATAYALGATVAVGDVESLAEPERRQLEIALRGLMPWRKGPFRLFGVTIDAEWRSDKKWARVAPHVELTDCRVLDVGCGNGYYGWRMLEAGAASVTGVDPSLLFTLQHAAVAYYLDQCVGQARNLVLPLRLEELDDGERFDVIFSMGVIYHRRDPQAHLHDLARHARGNTLLVLESLIVEGAPLVAPTRYAQMRNVHVVPDVATLAHWLQQAGFANATVVDVTATTTEEQRATAWMPFQSLADALDAKAPSRTIEGHPAPKRAVVIAQAPA